MEYAHETIYGGDGEGIGYYVDYRIETESLEGGVRTGSGTGALAAFMNCQVVAIDLDSGNATAIRDYTGGTTFSAASSPNGSPFDTLSNFQMQIAINKVIFDGMSKVVSEIFATQ